MINYKFTSDQLLIANYHTRYNYILKKLVLFFHNIVSIHKIFVNVLVILYFNKTRGIKSKYD